jgi:hypothetical protein
MLKLEVKKLIFKYSIITSVIGLILSELYISYSSKYINLILTPLLSIDMNNDGEPDLTQLKKYNLKLLKKYNLPIGLIIYHTFVLALKLILLMILFNYISKYVTS